jgi:hypothetical protein
MQVCAGHAAFNDKGSKRLLGFNNYIPRPEMRPSAATTTSCDHEKGASPVDGDSTATTLLGTDSYGSHNHDQPRTLRPESVRQEILEQTDGYFHKRIEGESNQPALLDHSSSDQQVPLEAAATTTELGFDWERWDAVFGHMGFSDMMDDVVWEDQ